MIKLIASDLDGTLLGHDFKFRPRTLAALDAAAKSGIDIVFVTGRPQRWLDPLRDQLEHDSYAICSNGAVVYHLGTQEVESTYLTPMSAVAAVHPTLARQFPQASFTLETLDTAYLSGDHPYSPVLDGIEVVHGDYRQILKSDQGVVKYLMKVEGADPQELLEATRPLVAEHLAVTIGLKDIPLMEMAVPGMNKGKTLARFAAERGISASEVLSFGDMLNDLEMLKWAGHGYAMASGSPLLLKEIERICPAFDQDGVAQIIEQVLAEEG